MIYLRWRSRSNARPRGGTSPTPNPPRAFVGSRAVVLRAAVCGPLFSSVDPVHPRIAPPTTCSRCPSVGCTREVRGSVQLRDPVYLQARILQVVFFAVAPMPLPPAPFPMECARDAIGPGGNPPCEGRSARSPVRLLGGTEPPALADGAMGRGWMAWRRRHGGPAPGRPVPPTGAAANFVIRIVRAEASVEPSFALRADYEVEPGPGVRADPRMKPRGAVRAERETRPRSRLRAVVRMEPLPRLRAVRNVEPTSRLRAIGEMKPRDELRAEDEAKPRDRMRAGTGVRSRVCMRLESRRAPEAPGRGLRTADPSPPRPGALHRSTRSAQGPGER